MRNQPVKVEGAPEDVAETQGPRTCTKRKVALEKNLEYLYSKYGLTNVGLGFLGSWGEV